MSSHRPPIKARKPRPQTEELVVSHRITPTEPAPEPEPPRAASGAPWLWAVAAVLLAASVVLGVVVRSLVLQKTALETENRALSGQYDLLYAIASAENYRAQARVPDDVRAVIGQKNNGDVIVMNNGDNGEIWIPVMQNMPKNEYIKDAFIEHESGEIAGLMTYEPAEGKALVGVDVSTYQEAVDWERVKAAGVDYAMLRLGYRGYETGNIYLDSEYEANIDGARTAGLPVGLYFFSQAVTPEEAVEEAQFLLSHIGDYQIDYPIVYDWEEITASVARTDEISARTLTDCAIAFCETIRAAGYTPAVYFYQWLGLTKYDLSRLTAYELWLAEYDGPPNFVYDFQMLQYTNTGSVPGITGEVDLNISFKDYAAG